VKTSDVCDAEPARVRVAAPVFRDFGGRLAFAGEAVTVRAPEDNSLVREALAEPGRGRVLVVDGGGSLACALLGDSLGELAVANGWAGVVVHGCVRDVAALARLPLGVKALAAHPRKSDRRGRGERNALLAFAGIEVRPGDRIAADEDGLVILPP
jgi:regulator of ribonuclease activity A